MIVTYISVIAKCYTLYFYWWSRIHFGALWTVWLIDRLVESEVFKLVKTRLVLSYRTRLAHYRTNEIELGLLQLESFVETTMGYGLVEYLPILIHPQLDPVE